MSNDFIPVESPKDSISASPAEIKQVLDWTQTVFGETKPLVSEDDIRIEVKRQDFNTLHMRQSCMGTRIKLGDREFDHGLGTHANSELVVHIPAGAKKFKAFAGIDNNYDTGGTRGTAIFSVEIGGKEVLRTGVLKCGDKPYAFNIDLPTGTREIVLKVDTTEDGPSYDQSDWADAHLVMSDGSTWYLDEGGDVFMLSSAAIPFSFKYNGVSSSEFIAKWNRKAGKQDKADRVCYTTSYTDPATGLVVTATATAFKEYPAVEWLLNFENKGSADTPIIEDIRTTDVNLITGESKTPVVLHQLHGDSMGDQSFLPFDTTLDSGGKMAMAPSGGRPSNSTAFPFWNLQFADRGFVTAVGWSGQWAAWFDRAADGTTRFQSGMEKTHLLLHPSEKIRTPRVLMMSWSGDRLAAQNRFRRLMLFKYVPQEDGRPLRLPIALQSFDRYHGTTWWPTEQGQLDAVKTAKELGCDTYWFDAAWFVGGFPNGVGNWFYKPKEFPNGLKPVGNLCKSLDLDFVVWFEPCRVAAGTQVMREHRQWVLGPDSGGLYNLGNPDARRWMTDLLSQRISESGITVYREDYNIDPLPFWRGNDAPDRQGLTEIQFVEGHYAMWDELRKTHPGLWIDNCASGGRRIDLETCMRSVPLWRSDTGCWAGHPEWNQTQSMGLSQFVPLNTCPGWEPTTYAFRSSGTAGALCELGYADPGFPKEAAKAVIAEARANRKYWYGDMYPLTPISTSLDQFFAYQLHRSDLNEGMVMAFRRPECSTIGLILGLNALDLKMKYQVEFIDGEGKNTTKTMTGDELMHAGLELRIAKKADSLLVRYKPAEK